MIIRVSALLQLVGVVVQVCGEKNQLLLGWVWYQQPSLARDAAAAAARGGGVLWLW